MERLTSEKTTEGHCLTEGKKHKSQIIQDNEFGISWSRREGRTVRRHDNKASVRTEQQGEQTQHRKPAKA